MQPELPDFMAEYIVVSFSGNVRRFRRALNLVAFQRGRHAVPQMRKGLARLVRMLKAGREAKPEKGVIFSLLILAFRSVEDLDPGTVVTDSDRARELALFLNLAPSNKIITLKKAS